MNPNPTPISPEKQAKMQGARTAAKNAVELVQNLLPGLDNPSLASKIAARVEQMPESCRRGYLTAVSGKSITAGVKAFCLECVGWSRPDVESCTAPACPLFPYRPFQERT